jgi:hypothetical protein
MVKTALVFVGLFLLAAAAQQNDEPHPKGVISNIVSRGKLAGTVLTDSTNDPIQNATVILHWNRPGQGRVPSQVPPNEMQLGDTRLNTDMLGKFSASLTPGFYDVTVLVRGYDAETHKLVEVRDSKAIFQMFWLISSSQRKP